MIVGAFKQQGLVTRAKVKTEYPLIETRGPGVFVSATVTKQGGSNDLSSIILEIDGQHIQNLTFIACANIGLDENNNSGTKMIKANVKTLTYQYNEPIQYKDKFKTSFHSGADSGVLQVVATAILAKGCSYPT